MEMAMGNIKKKYHMIKYLIVSLLFNIISCKSQETSKINERKMEKNDEKKLIEVIGNVNGGVINLSEDYSAQYFPSSNNLDYIFKINSLKSPITEIRIYHMKSKMIHILGYNFYDIPYGTEKEYDVNGKLIKETDYEKDYKFSIKDLCALIKKEYDVDLMIKSDPNIDKSLQYYIGRNKTEIFKGYAPFCYNVTFYIQEGGGGKTIFIDGETGKILFETIKNGYALKSLPEAKTVKVLTEDQFVKQNNK
jgi:hypothetical protein